MSIQGSIRLAALCSALVAPSLHAQAATAAPAAAPKNLEGSASLGFSKTSGNANATSINVSDKLKYTKKGWAIAQDLAHVYGKAEGITNADFWNAGLRGERKLMPKLGVFVATRFDRNELQGIKSRFEEGAGLDLTLVESPKNKFVISAGISMFQRSLTAEATSVSKPNYPAGRLNGDFKHTFSEKSFFQQTAEYLPNLSDTEAYLMNAESSLVAPLVANLGLKVGYIIRYNSQPPVSSNVALKKTDTFFSTGITYSF